MTPDRGAIGVWQLIGDAIPALAKEVELLGYGALWVGGSNATEGARISAPT
ncbi:MAG TPA: hypothetical protein VIY70_10505 [Acidimicrobiia bacterium]